MDKIIRGRGEVDNAFLETWPNLFTRAAGLWGAEVCGSRVWFVFDVVMDAGGPQFRSKTECSCSIHSMLPKFQP